MIRESSLKQIVATSILLVLALVPVAVASEGDTASITANVTNNWGEVPGAVVVLTDEDRSSTQTAVSGASGEAAFSSLAAGTYRITAELDGFVSYESGALELADGEQLSVEALLLMARFSTAITVTTVSRREQLLFDVAEPTTLIDEVQLLDTGGLTAKDILSEQAGAGITVHPGGGRGHVSINGVGNDGVLVLVDGRRYLGRDGTGAFDLDDLDMANVERIEVVKGAGSALYGTDAMGGVINIISKRASETGTKNHAELVVGSHSDYRIADRFEIRRQEFGLSLAASYRSSDGFDLDPEDPQTQGEPKTERFSFQGNADYDFSDRIVGNLVVSYSDKEVKENFFAGAVQLGEIFDQQMDKVRTMISPELNLNLGRNTAVDLRLDYSKYTRDETDVYPTVSEVLPTWTEWNTEAEATLKQAWKALGQDQLTLVGYEFRNQEMERELLLLPGTDSSRVERDLNVGWFQQELNITGKLTLTAGLRYDSDSEYGSESSPKLSAVFAPTETTRFRASWGEGFRAPRFGELFVYIPFFFVGNPDLEPETSESLTVGFTYAGTRAHASIDYFDTELDNAIVFDLGDFIPPFSYKNVPGISTREGLNVETAFDLPAGFTPSIAYSYIEAKDDDGEELGGFATHSGFFKLLWQRPQQGLRANLRAEYRGEETPGTSDGSYTPAYTLWNLQASKSLTLGDRKLRFWAGIDNLLDKNDIFRRDSSGNPIPGSLQVWQDGRNYLAGVALDMDW